MNVPTGYYDRQEASWIASDNGRVIKILSVSEGVVAMDTDGDDIADDGSSIGVTLAERQSLAALYSAGETLWRVPVTHFTPFDCNWPYLPVGATYPSIHAPRTRVAVEDQSCEASSIIECESLVLGESIPISGTPFTLEYRTSSAPGFTDQRTIDIFLTTDDLPPVKRIDLEVEIAGKRSSFSFAPAANLTQSFTWDARDAYNRPTSFERSLWARISYVYDGLYVDPGEVPTAFGIFPENANATIIPTRREVLLHREYRVVLRGPRPEQGLAGWTLSSIHSYDASSALLHLGSGTSLDMAARGLSTTSLPFGFTGGFFPARVRTGPDGSIYAIEAGLGGFIRHRSPEGLVTVIGGGATQPDDGVPLLESTGSFNDVVVHPSGELILLGGGVPNGTPQKIFRVHNGILRTLTTGSTIGSLTVVSDGSIFYTDDGNLMRVDLGGNVAVAAAASALRSYEGVRVGADGVVYVKVSEPIPGGSVSGIYRWPALDNRLITVFGSIPEWNADSAGRFYYIATDGFHGRGVQVIEPDGAEHPLQTEACVNTSSFALLPDGSLTCVAVFSGFCGPDDSVNSRCVLLASVPSNALLVSLPSGAEAYRFSTKGKLVEAIDPLTGSMRYTVTYDPATGFPSTIHDANGLITEIERAADGTPAGIVAPNGDRTELQIDAAGHLVRVIATDGTRELAYSEDGLLRSFRNPRGALTSFTYDQRGRLATTEDAAGGGKALVLQRTEASDTVHLTTHGGRTRRYEVRSRDAGSNLRVKVDAAGLATSIDTQASGTTVQLPGGTLIVSARQPDPLWREMAPVTTGLSMFLPSGRSLIMTSSRSTTPATPINPLIFTSITDTVTVGGRTYTSTYTASDRRQRITSPSGRIVSRVFDAKGRVAEITPPGLPPMTFSYDGRGRLTTVAQGSRNYSHTWDERDRLASVTDVAGRTISFSYDEASRVASQTLPGQGSVQFDHDENGNVTSIVPPGRPAHAFTFNVVDLPSSYTPPGSVSTNYAFDLDREISQVTLPEHGLIDLTYTGGRLTNLVSDDRALTFTYHPSGAPQRIVDSSGVTLDYGWDGGLPIDQRWSGTITGRVSWDYDNVLRIASESVNGIPVVLGYDNDSLLTSAGSLTLRRDAAGGWITGTTLNSITDEYTYNQFGEMSSYNATYNGAPLLSLSYMRDAAGRITAIGSQGFEYDAAGRLVHVTNLGALVAEYEYDANSNRVAHTYLGGSATATYDDQDRLLTYGDTVYEYTANGELKSKTIGGATTTFDYDALGNLRKVVFPGGSVIEYVIDGQNRRVGKKVDGTLVQGWLYGDQLRVVAELNGANSVVSRFVYGSRTNIPDYMIKAGVTYRILSDHLGSPRVVVNVADGSVAQSMSYDEFGRVLSDSAPGFQPFGFAGGLYDRDTGLVRFGAREYDAHTGRWTAKDPIGFGGGDTNLYGYVLSDPINGIDPTGLLVYGTYDNSSGVLSIRDADTGQSVTTFAESGGKPFGAPIPPGTYEVLERAGRADFFRLDKIDESVRDDIDQATGRTHFRLHKPGRTIGCIAAKDAGGWEQVKTLINGTRTTTVPDFAHPWWKFWATPEPITRYGFITVK